MIRAFIAIELNNKETIEKINTFTLRLKKNQEKLKIVEQQNLHLTLKFLGNIPETKAPKIYSLLKSEINTLLFEGKTLEFVLQGVGQFNKYSVIWIKLVGDIPFLQNIKSTIENILYNNMNIDRDKRTQFKPHLTIGRLKRDKINYKSFDTFKNIINDNRKMDFGVFSISEVKLKKSVLTPKGPLYSDLIY